MSIFERKSCIDPIGFNNVKYKIGNTNHHYRVYVQNRRTRSADSSEPLGSMDNVNRVWDMKMGVARRNRNGLIYNNLIPFSKSLNSIYCEFDFVVKIYKRYVHSIYLNPELDVWADIFQLGFKYAWFFKILKIFIYNIVIICHNIHYDNTVMYIFSFNSSNWIE